MKRDLVRNERRRASDSRTIDVKDKVASISMRKMRAKSNMYVLRVRRVRKRERGGK